MLYRGAYLADANCPAFLGLTPKDDSRGVVRVGILDSGLNSPFCLYFPLEVTPADPLTPSSRSVFLESHPPCLPSSELSIVPCMTDLGDPSSDLAPMYPCHPCCPQLSAMPQMGSEDSRTLAPVACQVLSFPPRESWQEEAPPSLTAVPLLSFSDVCFLQSC